MFEESHFLPEVRGKIIKKVFPFFAEIYYNTVTTKILEKDDFMILDSCLRFIGIWRVTN